MHTILTGATGLVGSAVLDAMLSNPSITKITILSRRPVPQATTRADPRVSVVIHEDFSSYDSPALRSRIGDATGCVWALGISQSQVSSELEYDRITRTFALEAARAFGAVDRSGKPFNFVYVSGEGATLTPGRFTPLFGRVKGRAEAELAALRDENPLLRTSSVRAGFVDSAAHDAIKPFLPPMPRMTTLAGAVLGPPIRHLYKSMWSPTQPLGSFLVDMAVGKWSEGEMVAAGAEKVGTGGFTIIPNVVLRKLARLDG